MSQIDAPLVVATEALCVWLLPRLQRWPARAFDLLGAPLFAEARALHGAVRLALVFPRRRRYQQRVADEALARLRGLVAVAERVGLLDDEATTHLATELTGIGRMIGGWRKRWRRRRRRTQLQEIGPTA